MPIRTLIIVLLAVAALSGCGRRGDLEPPEAAVAEQGAPAQALPADGISPLDPGSGPLDTDTQPVGGAPETPPPTHHNRPFFLDFLL
jgi:predicted small lipoprotein YifL